ncbi:hypothetical protein EDD86DRAFT_209291 [Gorgonomyces haynaldii]|nr:hypothetical protein EDD86DRAFT_209291 [Gorgonomyces haynaldii]
MEYDPCLYASLEFEDALLYCDERIDLKFGTVLKTLSNPEWEMGNYCKLNPIECTEQERLEMIDQVEALLEIPRFVFFDATTGTEQVQQFIQTLNSRGYKMETVVSHCMGIIQEWLMDAPERHRVTRATLDDLEDVLSVDTEPGFASASWLRKRTEQRLVSGAQIYLGWNDRPQSRVSYYIGQKALVTRLDTRPESRRQGFGRDVMTHSLRKVFESVKEVYLFQIDAGAQKFYESIGFRLLDSRQEYVFFKE